MIKFERVVNAAGDGWWNAEAGPVECYSIELCGEDDEFSFWIYHEHISKGFLYTDSFIENLRQELVNYGLAQELANTLEWSEQGMQIWDCAHLFISTPAAEALIEIAESRGDTFDPTDVINENERCEINALENAINILVDVDHEDQELIEAIIEVFQTMIFNKDRYTGAAVKRFIQ